MFKLGIIEHSESQWSSPVVLLKKKNGSWRFYVDYRRVNKITKKDVYHSPRIDDALDKLSGASLFSTLDFKAGYWQIEVDERYREKTAFITPDGLYKFKVIPFGSRKIEAIREFRTPKTISQVRSFLWSCTYYRRFVHDFVDIARPLHELLKQDDNFLWKEHQLVFIRLKSLLTTDLVVGIFKPEAKILIQSVEEIVENRDPFKKLLEIENDPF
ncbi:hypothetical protein TNCV_3093451 [Trichonephila clavipes]|nr:hypothetical protein TNCV_3093451 [Trichonephila clavipes]